MLGSKRKEKRGEGKGGVFVTGGGDEKTMDELNVSKCGSVGRRSIYTYIERTCLNVVSKLSRDNR